jgi:hypothetical protein
MEAGRCNQIEAQVRILGRTFAGGDRCDELFPA